MKIKNTISLLILMVISVSTFAQFAGNADLLIPTKSGSKPLLGVSAYPPH